MDWSLVMKQEDYLLLSDGIKYREEKRYDKAIVSFKKALEKSPDLPDAYFLLGLTYMNTSRLVIAIGYYTKYINLKRNNPTGWYLIGLCVHKYTEYAESRLYFVKALRFGIGSEFPDVYLWLGESYLRNNKPKQAFKVLSIYFENGIVSDYDRLMSFLFKAIKQSDKPLIGKKKYTTAIVERLKKELIVEDIICVGDSHVLAYESIQGLNVYQTGSPTAYNLLSDNSSSQGMSQIKGLLKSYDPQKTAVMFTYAEIDIRGHIYRNIIKSSLGVKEACSVVVERYFCAINMIADLGFKVLINGPFGTGLGVPRTGKEKERNIIAICIDEILKRKCKQYNIPYASLVDIIVDSSFCSDSNYFGEVDDNHLDKCEELAFLVIARFIESGLCHSRKQVSMFRDITIKQESVVHDLGVYGVAYKEKGDGIVKNSTISFSVQNNKLVYCLDQPTHGFFNCLLLSLEDHYELSDLVVSIDSASGLSLPESIKVIFYKSSFEQIYETKLVRQSGLDNARFVLSSDVEELSNNEMGWYVKIEISCMICSSVKIGIKILSNYKSFVLS